MKETWMSLKLFGLLLLVPLAAPAATSPSAARFKAVDFDSTELLPSRQRELLEDYLRQNLLSFQNLTSDYNGIAATYLAVTRALSFLQIRLEDGRWISAMDMVSSINRLEGDRVKVRMDSTLFGSWRRAGAEYSLSRANGKTEHGHFHFNRGDLGGSLHHGDDIQGYTSVFKVPRIQINYRFSDQEADIDLDGYAPWIIGFIPDPYHLTWKNSDVRYWFSKYLKSFGAPGFSVVEKVH
jgi:hypothetical protein